MTDLITILSTVNRDLRSADGFMCGRRNPVGMSVVCLLSATFALILEANSALESERGHCQFYFEYLPVRYQSMLCDVMCWNVRSEPD